MEEHDLIKLQKAILIIAKEIKRICEKNNIEYTMIGGTLLGAIRHKGFIPWDDDFDFAMTKNNYKRFLYCCKRDLNDEYEVIDWHSDKNYPHAFLKVMLKGTKTVQYNQETANFHQGIFVDVFSFENIPDNYALQLIQNTIIKMCVILLQDKAGCGNRQCKKIKKGCYVILDWLSKFISHSRLVKSYEKVLCIFENVSGEYCTNAGFNYMKSRVPRYFFESYELLKFEDTEFMAIKESHAFLSQFYGDYMKLPAKEERRNHSFVKVDYGKIKF